MGHTLDDLALLVDVVRAGGVRAVARDLGLPRSTVSRKLQRLETSLGVGLKRKGTGALALSEAAQSTFERLARLVDEAREISDELGNQQTEPRGVLRLATTSLFAENLLPELMTRYLAANPKVRVEVLSSTDRLDLTTERIDVAIRSGPIEDLATWTSKKLRAATTVGLYASPAYLKRRGSPPNVEALGEHELLVSTRRAAGSLLIRSASAASATSESTGVQQTCSSHISTAPFAPRCAFLKPGSLGAVKTWPFSSNSSKSTSMPGAAWDSRSRKLASSLW